MGHGWVRPNYWYKYFISKSHPISGHDTWLRSWKMHEWYSFESAWIGDTIICIKQDAEEVIRTMKTTGLGSPSTNAASIDAFRTTCHQRFPYAIVFFPPNTYTGPQVPTSCLLQYYVNFPDDDTELWFVTKLSLSAYPTMGPRGSKWVNSQRMLRPWRHWKQQCLQV